MFQPPLFIVGDRGVVLGQSRLPVSVLEQKEAYHSSLLLVAHTAPWRGSSRVRVRCLVLGTKVWWWILFVEGGEGRTISPRWKKMEPTPSDQMDPSSKKSPGQQDGQPHTKKPETKQDKCTLQRAFRKAAWHESRGVGLIQQSQCETSGGRSRWNLDRSCSKTMC